jgi:hypothetical protein
MNAAPIVKEYGGIFVVRDDLFPGGTKARFLPVLFEKHKEVVYASPAQGGAQTALAHTAFRLGKRATIFVAKRKRPHDRALEAKRMGARIFQVPNGYLNVVQARARKYCSDTGALLAPFGLNLPEAIDRIAADARRIDFVPDTVWCASGSGVLARSLKKAWPNASVHCVQVGRTLSPSDVAHATIHVHSLSFDEVCKTRPPFPSDPHYDAKAWEVCWRKKGAGKVLFWNVTGPAQP